MKRGFIMHLSFPCVDFLHIRLLVGEDCAGVPGVLFSPLPPVRESVP